MFWSSLMSFKYDQHGDEYKQQYSQCNIFQSWTTIFYNKIKTKSVDIEKCNLRYPNSTTSSAFSCNFCRCTGFLMPSTVDIKLEFCNASLQYSYKRKDIESKHLGNICPSILCFTNTAAYCGSWTAVVSHFVVCSTVQPRSSLSNHDSHRSSTVIASSLWWNAFSRRNRSDPPAMFISSARNYIQIFDIQD